MDIVEKLRSANASMGVRDPEKYICPLTVADANRVADEIERLRELSAEMTTRAIEKEREKARLREALQHLLDVQNGPPLAGQYAEEWQTAVDKARAALVEEK